MSLMVMNKIMTPFTKIRLQAVEELSKHTRFAIMLPIIGPFPALSSQPFKD